MPRLPKFLEKVANVPLPSSPISNAVIVGNICWISGQLSIDADGKYISGSARAEAERAFQLVFSIAEGAGFCVQDIVYVDIAFADLNDLPEINQLYAELFLEGRRPARTVYQAAKLPYGGKIKIQAVAARESNQN